MREIDYIKDAAIALFWAGAVKNCGKFFIFLLVDAAFGGSESFRALRNWFLLLAELIEALVARCKLWRGRQSTKAIVVLRSNVRCQQ